MIKVRGRLSVGEQLEHSGHLEHAAHQAVGVDDRQRHPAERPATSLSRKVTPSKSIEIPAPPSSMTRMSVDRSSSRALISNSPDSTRLPDDLIAEVAIHRP
ncbi:hypothetical protein AB0M36_20255 [Actinoplanes sp. NPDC051346]|uniref:hypothetical protein n=1 Tax=Actinoplanes sp. NPDC051346 TaxID=3155048 RepID=UPI00341BF9F5